MADERKKDMRVALELNPVNWTAQERTEFLAKGFRTLRDTETPLVSPFIRPEDYAHDLKRGTVLYREGYRNYALHTVFFPMDTVVRDCNFMQSFPNTPCIIAQGRLTLIDCNLTNVAIDPSWRLERGNTAQCWIVRENGQETTRFICSHPRELPNPLDVPPDAITSRPF